MIGAALAALAGAMAADLALLRTQECFGAATRCVVEVAVAVDGRPLRAAPLTVEARPPKGARAGVVEALGEGAPGRYRFVVPRDATVVARLGDAEPRALGVVDLVARVAPSVGDTVTPDAAVGAPVTLRFPLLGPVDPERLVIATSEGRVAERRVEGDRLVVLVEPGPERAARVLQVGVLDLTHPGAVPAWGVATLRARQTADVVIGAGDRATVVVGRRSYGPFQADASGNARLVFDVLPGETSATIAATDDLGNARTVVSPLPTPTAPVVTTLAWPLAAEGGVGVWARALTADGRPRPEPAPACAGPDGPLELAADAGGAWVATWSRGATGTTDVLVECAAELGLGRARVTLGAGQPARVDLRVYPDTLASDFPLAQVQATLLDSRGERLSPDGLTVTAAAGALLARVEDGAVRGEYNGEAAIARGGDEIEARWSAPPGAGGVWGLSAWATADGGGVTVRARLLDRAGNPLADEPARFTTTAGAVEARSDARGWVTAALPLPPEALPVVTVRAGLLRRDVAVFPGAPEPLPDPAAPDRVERRALPIRGGTVRRIFLDVSPRPLVLGGGQVGRVEVQLLDSAGNQVRGELVSLSADLGTLSEPRPRPDGTLEAVYEPPPNTTAPTARITAAVGSVSVATDLELVPRPVRGAFGVDVGWIANFAAVSSPTVSMSVTTRVPGLPSLFAARVGASTWSVSRSVSDEATGGIIDVKAQFLGVDVGPALVERRGRRMLDAGVSLSLVPYGLTVAYGDEGVETGLVLPAPGVLAHGGVGYRLGASEVYGELRYLFSPPDNSAVRFAGGIGGLSGSLGYRVLF